MATTLTRPAACVTCARPLRPQGRPDLPGVAHQAHGMCNACYERQRNAARYPTGLPRTTEPYSAAEFAAEVTLLRDSGERDHHKNARRMGMKTPTYLRALERAIVAGRLAR